jgi:ABC-2 type transport system permease protein
VIITLAFGILFLRLPVDPLRIDYGLLGVALVIGLWGITSLGIILAAISLLVARHSSYMNEGVAGLFYLLCGAIFPIEVLPAWLQPVSRALPFTYWLEAIRRAVLPGVDPISKSMAAFSTSALLLILVTTTVSLSLVSHLTFRLCEHRARSKGLIDRTTAY